MVLPRSDFICMFQFVVVIALFCGRTPSSIPPFPRLLVAQGGNFKRHKLLLRHANIGKTFIKRSDFPCFGPETVRCMLLAHYVCYYTFSVYNYVATFIFIGC